MHCICSIADSSLNKFLSISKCRSFWDQLLCWKSQFEFGTYAKRSECTMARKERFLFLKEKQTVKIGKMHRRTREKKDEEKTRCDYATHNKQRQQQQLLPPCVRVCVRAFAHLYVFSRCHRRMVSFHFIGVLSPREFIISFGKIPHVTSK